MYMVRESRPGWPSEAHLKARESGSEGALERVGTTAAAQCSMNDKPAAAGIPSCPFSGITARWLDLLEFLPGIEKVGIRKGCSSRIPAQNESGHALHPFRQVVQKLAAGGDIVVSTQQILQQRCRSSVAPDDTAPAEERPEELNPVAQVLEGDPELVTLFVVQFRQLLATLFYPTAKPVDGASANLLAGPANSVSSDPLRALRHARRARRLKTFKTKRVVPRSSMRARTSR